MRVRIIDTTRAEPSDFAARFNEHIAGILRAMTTFDEHRAAEMAGEHMACRHHVVLTGDAFAILVVDRVGTLFDGQLAQRLGFRHIRRDDGGQREQLGSQCRNRVAFDKLRAGRCHHHRIKHNIRGIMRNQTVGDHVDELHARHHADLHRDRRNIFKYCVDLRGEHFRRSVRDHGHACGVLRGQRRDGGHTEHAIGKHGFQIRLNAGTTGGIRSRDAQYRCQSAGHE